MFCGRSWVVGRLPTTCVRPFTRRAGPLNPTGLLAPATWVLRTGYSRCARGVSCGWTWRPSRRRRRRPAAPETQRRYRVALELYPGELLPDDRYEEWVETRRRELGGTFHSALIDLAGLYGDRGEYGRGVETLQRSLSVEPTNEEAHAGLMGQYALSGRQQEALAQYEQSLEGPPGKLRYAAWRLHPPSAR